MSARSITEINAEKERYRLMMLSLDDELNRAQQVFDEYKIKQQKAHKLIHNFLRPEKDDKNSESVAKVKNKIITAPTQVGKTASIIELLGKSQGWLSVVSCDNKKDQQLQVVNRFKQANLNVFELNKCKKQQFTKILMCIAKKESVTIIMLNNAIQIEKLTTLIKKILQNVPIKNYICIHDEADMVNKADDLKDIRNTQIAASHRQWIVHFTVLKSFFSRIRRVWVTATCENCSNLQDIKAKEIVVLPTPPDYRTATTNIEWTGDNQYLHHEIDRIRLEKTGEVILYCYDTLIANQVEHAEALSKDKDCITIIYNSGYRKIYGYTEYSVFSKSIDEVLKDLRYTNLPVVIFGSELMGRGMSFVGSNKDKPLTATVIFHKDTASTTAVNIAQKFGRITGTSRPDLTTRKIYSSNKAWNDYQNYLYNQKAIYANLENYPDLNMTEILKIINSKTLGRKVDRPSLKKVNAEYSENSDNSSENSSATSVDTQTDNLKMNRLVKSWAQIANTTPVAVLFRKMIENDGKMNNNTVKEMLKNNDSTYYIKLAQKNHSSMWYTVFSANSNYHFIKKEAIQYYISLN